MHSLRSICIPPLFGPIPVKRKILEGDLEGRACEWLSGTIPSSLFTYGLTMVIAQFALGALFPHDSCSEEHVQSLTRKALWLALPVTFLAYDTIQEIFIKNANIISFKLTWKKIFAAAKPFGERESILASLEYPLSLSEDVRAAYLSGGREKVLLSTPWLDDMVHKHPAEYEWRNDMYLEAYAFAVHVEVMVRFLQNGQPFSNSMIEPFSLETVEWMEITFPRFMGIYAHSMPPFLKDDFPNLYARLIKKVEEAAATAAPHHLFLSTIPLIRTTNRGEFSSQESQAAYIYFLLHTDEIEPLFDAFSLPDKARERLQVPFCMDPVAALIEALNSSDDLVQVFFKWTQARDFHKLRSAQLAVKKNYTALKNGGGPIELRKWLTEIALRN